MGRRARYRNLGYAKTWQDLHIIFLEDDEPEVDGFISDFRLALSQSNKENQGVDDGMQEQEDEVKQEEVSEPKRRGRPRKGI